MDLLYLALTCGFFLLTGGLVVALGKL